MAKGSKTGGRDWKPGQSGNPRGAAAHDPNMKAVRALTREQVAEVGALVLSGNVDDLRKIIGDPKNGIQPDPTATPLKIWFATVALKGISKGDMFTFNAMLDRIIGKSKESIDLSNSDGSMKPTFIFETVVNAKKD